MGRADLSRHRKTSPSDIRPIRFPPSAEWVLPQLAQHPHLRISRAVTSINNASTQREQVQAVKLLGISLRDAHSAEGQNHPAELKCACTLPSSDIAPICTLAVPVLLAVLFETPAATAGLTSGALRAALMCRQVGVTDFDEAVRDFVARIAGWIHREDCEDDEMKDETRENDRFLQAAADVSALAVVLAEQKSRHWILDKEESVLGALALVCYIADLYRHTAIIDQPKPSQPSHPAHTPDNTERIAMSINRALAEASCDSAMKAAQDIINFLLRLPADSEVSMTTKCMNAVERTTLACEQVLELPMAPRSCAMACSVAHVSGIVFQCARDGNPDNVSAALHDQILARLNQFPPFSQLSLLRSVMEAPAAKPALPLILLPRDGSDDGAKNNGSVFDLLASITTANADVHLRFLAMDALIACLRRQAPNKLSLHCRNVVLSLVYERWQEPFPGVSSQIRETMEALVNVDGGDEEATSFWSTMAKSLMKGDWHLKGIYAPLIVLVKRLGALRLLDVEPNCPSFAMHAAGTDSRLAKPASDWMAMFWTVLWTECLPAKSRFYDLTNKDLVLALVDGRNDSLRDRTTEYMLPTYLRAVGQENVEVSAIALLCCLKTMSQDGSASRIRGTICIMSAARRCGVFIGSFSDPSVCNLLHDALRSGVEDLRASALDLVVTSRVSTEPISEQEFDLVRSYLPSALMPGGSPSDRSRFRHSMRRFLERLAACRHAARNGSGGWWMRERKQKYGGVRTIAFEEQRTELLRRVAVFEYDCTNLLLASAYPGAPFARMTNALEVLLLVCRNLSSQDSPLSGGSQAEAGVSGLVACLLDEWERPRRSALQVLTSLDDPLAGFEATEKVEELQKFALPHLNSPRQKQVDSGASIFRCVFRKFVLSQEHKSDPLSLNSNFVHNRLLFSCEHDGKCRADPPIHLSPGLAYACSVLDSLDAYASFAEKEFMKSCERGLFHGLCLLLRYIIQDLPWKELSSPNDFDGARTFVKRFLDLYWRCTRIAINGVSFQSFDQANGSENDIDRDGTERVDNILLQEEKQVVSTSCFLSMKEICVCLGILCHEVPFGNVAGRNDDCDGILSFEQISSVIELFRFVFTSTRHWGVIDGASEGLQLLCERLLRTSSARLRVLPSQLAATCLQSALGGELYVLRRSAGIPALFAAILNAEASSHTRCHDTPLLNRVVSELLEHLQNSHMYTEEAKLRESRTQEEESIVHALNLLRSMFLNGNIASNILKYLEPAAMACINAFCSASWLIRNSAMMLFSALVRRGIGVCVERRSATALSSFDVAGGTSATLDGERRLRGVTAFQFFSRHPRLHPFLLQQLETAIYRFKHHGKSDHPTLFPTLYLLSSLSPAAAEDPTTTLSMSPFRAMLRDCLHWRSNYVRRVAAAACVPLIDDSGHVAKVVEEYLCTGIPTEPQHVYRQSCQIAGPLAPNDRSPMPLLESKKSYLAQNHLHGELLALAAILKGMRRTMSALDKNNTLKVLAERLPSRIWIARDAQLNPCSVTRASMLVVLRRSYELARDVKNITVKFDDDSAYADVVISLCKHVATQLNESERETYGLGMEVGLSSLLCNSAKLLAFITVTSFEEREIALDEAIETLSKLLFSSKREVMIVGMDSTSQLLKRNSGTLPTNTGRTVEDSSPDVLKCLGRAWKRTSQVLSIFDDQELLVEALRLQNAILTRSGDMHGRIEEISADLTIEKLTSILQIARSHPCVDVREHAIVLSGQLISKIQFDEDLTIVWISLVEDAISSQQPPSTRIAASTSFETSGLGRMHDATEPNFVEEVRVRGFLLLAQLLDDENVEVRSHVIGIVYRCKKSAGERDAFPSDILPSLMWIYKHLCTRFSKSGFLFQHLEDLLVIPAAPGKSDEKDELITLIKFVVGAKSWLGEGEEEALLREGKESTHKVLEPTTVTRNTRSQRLFQSEDNASDTETVVRMQLIAWCYRTIILRCTNTGTVSHDQAVVLCVDLVSNLRDDLRKATRQGEGGIISGDVFTSEGFQSCYRTALRLVLGITCLQASGLADDGEEFQAQSLISERLSDIIEEHGIVLHSAILAVITEMQILLSDQAHSRHECNLRRIFFMLQV